jgi:hypothetical protein
MPWPIWYKTRLHYAASKNMSALFSFDQDETDPKTLKRRIEAILTKATAQQLKQIYGHVRHVMES